jgi:C4-type Zn-finger protein
MDEQTGSLFNVKDKGIPKLNQCLICQKWTLEKLMSPVEIPSQGSEYVQKLACKGCLNGSWAFLSTPVRVRGG